MIFDSRPAGWIEIMAHPTKSFARLVQCPVQILDKSSRDAKLSQDLRRHLQEQIIRRAPSQKDALAFLLSSLA